MKAKSRNSVSAYARVSGAKASPQCSRAESESGGVSRFSGEETRESGPLFCFPSSPFELQSIGDLVVWGVGRNRRARWEWVCALAHGMRVQRVQRGEEKNTARNASQWRCALSRYSSFVFMLSLDSGEKAPVFFFGL